MEKEALRIAEEALRHYADLKNWSFNVVAHRYITYKPWRSDAKRHGNEVARQALDDIEAERSRI